MKKISSVLCVVDPTADDQHAVDRAAWICGKTEAALELLICTYNEYLSGERFFDSRSLQSARRDVLQGYSARLEEMAKPLRESGLSVSTKAQWDHPLHEGIVRYAAATDADLVVKDTHYHSTMARAFLSNTDWQLIRNCSSLLWLVKPHAIAEPPVFIAALDPMNEHDKPAALDDAILVTCKSLAKLTGGSVHAFHAFDPQIAAATATANAYLPVSWPPDEVEKDMRERHGARLREITAYHEIADEQTHLVSARTEEALPALAKELNAAVVVMGAIARNPIKRLFIGATAERTMDHLPCDLLVVKPDWHKTPAAILSQHHEAA